MANDEKKNVEDDDVDALLTSARSVEPGADLMARVMADAARAQQENAAEAPAQPRIRAKRAGLFTRPPAWVAALGGWGSFGGVTAAGIVGLAVGFWSPDMVDVLSGGQIWSLTGTGTSLSPDLSDLAIELVDA